MRKQLIVFSRLICKVTGSEQAELTAIWTDHRYKRGKFFQKTLLSGCRCCNTSPNDRVLCFEISRNSIGPYCRTTKYFIQKRISAKTLLLLLLLLLHGGTLLKELTSSQLVKKFPAFYGTRMFITAFTRADHLSLFWGRSIQFMPPHPTSWRSILILSFYLRRLNAPANWRKSKCCISVWRSSTTQPKWGDNILGQAVARLVVRPTGSNSWPPQSPHLTPSNSFCGALWEMTFTCHQYL